MKYLLSIIFIAFCATLPAQEVLVLMKEAQNLERSFKEPEALDKYKQAIVAESNNTKALVKATELNCSIGNRTSDKTNKRLLYETALAFANRAVKADSTSAEAYYALALASGKMTEVETENKKIVQCVKDSWASADKALRLNPNHAKANFVMGKWHMEMLNINSIKKVAVTLFYGGLPQATLENAILVLEKSKTLDPYFMPTYVELAKAYKQDYKVAKQMDILGKIVKLPIRMFDDIALKAEAQKQLNELQ